MATKVERPKLRLQDTTIRVRVGEWGNCLAMRVPAWLVSELKLKVREHVQVRTDGNKNKATRVHKPGQRTFRSR